MADGTARSYSALVDLNNFSEFVITFKRSGETDADVALSDMTAASAGSAYVHHTTSGDHSADITGIYAPWSNYKSVLPGYRNAIIDEMTSKSWSVAELSVTFDNTTGKYTFDAGPSAGGAFGINFNNAENKKFFGFTNQTMTGASSYTSDMVAYYCIVPSIDARSNFTREYEPGNISSLAVSDSGQVKKGIARATVPMYMDWQQPFEPQANVLIADRASADLYTTWEDFWKYCRQEYPFVVSDSATTFELHMLRATSSNFRPESMDVDNHEYWHLNFETHFIGRYP